MDHKHELENHARHLVANTPFPLEDARRALERALDYFSACGNDEAKAWDQATMLVAIAAHKARELDFDLPGMVDQVLLGMLHRVHVDCRL